MACTTSTNSRAAPSHSAHCGLDCIGREREGYDANTTRGSGGRAACRSAACQHHEPSCTFQPRFREVPFHISHRPAVRGGVGGHLLPTPATACSSGSVVAITREKLMLCCVLPAYRPKSLDTEAQVMRPPTHEDDRKQEDMTNVAGWSVSPSCSSPTTGSLASFPLWSFALDGAR